MRSAFAGRNFSLLKFEKDCVKVNIMNTKYLNYFKIRGDHMTKLVKNAKIYDGTGADAFIGDILMEGDKIVRVSPSISGDAD